MIVIETKCKTCGKPFEYDRIHGKGRPKEYCSRECYPKKEKICQSCGCVFLGHHVSKYCSKKCYGKVRHKQARLRVCTTCNKEFIPEIKGSHAYCSYKCTPKTEKNCLWCGREMMLDTTSRAKKYCSAGCKQLACAKIARQKQKAKRIEKQKNERKQLAQALRLWKRGTSIYEIEKTINIPEGSGSGFLLKSKGYRNKTKKRKDKSTWHSKEVAVNARSGMFRLEHEFRDWAALEASKHFDKVDVEVSIPNSRRKIDMVVSHGLWTFGIELKNENRTARLDQTLGQAIIKCFSLGNLIPVCCVPDDLQIDDVFKKGCMHAGVMAGTFTSCINQMFVKCGISTVYNPKKLP